MTSEKSLWNTPVSVQTKISLCKDLVLVKHLNCISKCFMSLARTFLEAACWHMVWWQKKAKHHQSLLLSCVKLMFNWLLGVKLWLKLYRTYVNVPKGKLKSKWYPIIIKDVFVCTSYSCDLAGLVGFHHNALSQHQCDCPCLPLKWQCQQGAGWSPSHQGFINSYSKSRKKKSYCPYLKNNDPIRSQFCTCHDSWAVVTCANLWPD